MKIPTMTYQELIKSVEVLNKNKYFEQSFQGFLMNLYRSFKEKIITSEQKNEILSMVDIKSDK